MSGNIGANPEKDINPEIKINDIKRFIVNSSASVQYENISVVLSKRRDIIEQAPTYEISGDAANLLI